MTTSKHKIEPEMIRRFLDLKGLTAKQLAKELSTSEASIFRWLQGAQPTGTAGAILGLLIVGSGIASTPKLKSWAARGLSVFKLICSTIDPHNGIIKDLEERLCIQNLKELQQEELEIISKELGEAEQQAIEDIQQLHREQRKCFQEELRKEHGKKIEKLRSTP